MGLVVFKKNGDMHGSMKDEYGMGVRRWVVGMRMVRLMVLGR